MFFFRGVSAGTELQQIYFDVLKKAQETWPFPGAGDGIRTHDPNLGNGPERPRHNIRQYPLPL
jgi:hypothetical protein